MCYTQPHMKPLPHTVRTLSSGGSVLVLNTGATITPEAQAMLAALHSRSTGGVQAHLETLAAKGPSRFMETYYVGYGHKSIGDLGSATVFVEGISMLAAKALQHWPLYNGQESSTRYIDFSRQPLINPAGTKEAQHIQEVWRSFYQRSQEPTRAWVRERFVRNPDEDEKLYEKAVAARAFDILRAFLPAGTATNIAWHGTLRQFADALLPLRHHPLVEVREIAEATLDALTEAFPSSFSRKFYEATEAYYEKVMRGAHHYLAPAQWPEYPTIAHDGTDSNVLREHEALLRERPPKSDLPYIIGLAGSVRIEGLLDFGSWRDLQRHRALTQAPPLLTPHFGFHPWYLEELPQDARDEARDLIKKQEERLHALNLEPPTAQYYLPMGYRVPISLRGDLRALVYLIELRSTRFVHPTLRAFVLQTAALLQERFAWCGLTLHLDAQPDRFDVARGKQDIFVAAQGGQQRLSEAEERTNAKDSSA